ncbi:MAG: Hsp70 family protein [Phycisphaerae bacterium]
MAKKPRIVSLKRLLDFDRFIPTKNSDINSVDAFAKELAWIKDQCSGGGNAEAGNFVIAVPSCFSQRQRAAVLAAAQKAALSRVKLVNDTTAVLLAFAESIRKFGSILVYSWGATAFSVSLFKQTKDGLQTIVQEGTLDLGGEAIDSAIFRQLLRDKLGNSSVWDLNDTEAMSHLAEEAKRIRAIASVEKCEGRQQIEREDSAEGGVDNLSMAVMKNVYRDTFDSLLAETFKLVDKVLSTAPGCKPEGTILSGKIACLAETKNAVEVKLGVRLVEASEESVAVGALLYGETIPQAEWQKAESDFLEAKTKIGTSSVVDRRTNSVAKLQVNAKSAEDGWSAIFLPLLQESENQYKHRDILGAINTLENLRGELDKFNIVLYRDAAGDSERSGRLDEALKILEKARQRYPSNRLIVFDFADLCCKKADLYIGKHVGGLNNILKVMDMGIHAVEKLPKEYGNSQLRAKMLHTKAWILCREGGQSYLKKAASLIQCSANLDPSQPAYKQDYKKIQEALKKKTKLAAPVIPMAQGHDRDRNQPCWCGSSKKYKKCHGSPRKR